MFSKLKDIAKGIKKMADEKIQLAKEVLSSAKNKIVLGIIVVGIGSGLIVAGYVQRSLTD